ncbi:MAG: choice-of-anchor H family protein [Woeseiaceae bacterium]|nr:choice-of-anchor H family protein [Woeseiaceae bacterium]
MKNVTRTISTICLLLLAGASMATTGEEPRQSLTSEGQGITRGSVGDGKVSFNEFAPLKTEGSRDPKNLRSVQQKGGVVNARSGDPNFWFYEADVVLFSDFDNDGYYFGIDLMFDADTTWAAADVFAVVYLSYEYGPWNEYAETEDFTIYGASGDDSYIIETELVSGYPTGSYDILIELFDAFDGTYLTSIGPDDTSELALLPLEDSVLDTPAGTTTQVVVSSGGGGSVGFFLLCALLALRMTRRPQAASESK